MAFLLALRHGPERIAVELPAVREVLRMVALRPLPGAPPGVLGVLDLRAQAIPVLDLEQRLPSGADRPGVDHQLVVLHAGELLLAIAVTAVDDLEEVPDEEIQPASALLPRGIPLKGLARTSRGLLPIIDPDTFLRRDEVMALRSAIQELEGGKGRASR